MMKSSDVPVQPSNMATSSSVVSDGVSSAMSAMSLDGSSLRIKQKLHEPVSTHKKEKVKGPIGEGKMMKVIGLQHANGSFKLGGAVLPKILDSSLDEIIEGEVVNYIYLLLFHFSSNINKTSFDFLNSRTEGQMPR